MIIIDAGTLVAQCTGMMKDYVRLDDEMRLDMVRRITIRSIINWVTPNIPKFGNKIIIANDKGYPNGGGYWRNKINPYYKKNRKTMSRPDLVSVFKNLSIVKKEIKEFLPFNFIEIDGVEADDIIATICIKQAEENKNGDFFDLLTQEEILVISADHDMSQLLEFPRVSVYSPIKNKFLKATPIEIRNLKIEHIIKGDSGDGICNILSDEDTLVIEGKRQKSVPKKLLQEYMDDWNETIKKYPEHVDRIKRNIDMVIMKSIPPEIMDQIDKAYHDEIERPKDRSKVFNYMGEKGLMDVLPLMRNIFPD